jgi:hypothetical protein
MASAEVIEAAPVVTARTPARKTRPHQQRRNAAVARTSVATYSISKEQEYVFIREDMRRLLYTAGILIVVMIGLLFVVDR